LFDAAAQRVTVGGLQPIVGQTGMRIKSQHADEERDQQAKRERRNKP